MSLNISGRVPAVLAMMRGREGAWLLAFGASAWIVVFGRLGYTSLLDPDEAHYAQLTREMIRARSWFVPLLDGSPFIDKPVLFHWLQMASVWLFGESEFALRLPSAAAGITLVLVTRWLAAELFGTLTGNVAAVMFATLPFTFALANVALFDMVYTAFLFSAVACLVVAAVHGRERLQYTGYALLTLAVMTKGPIALLLVFLWGGVAAAVSGTVRRALRELRWGTGVLIVVVLSCPWFVYMWWAFDDRFVRDYLLAGNLWYFTGPKVFSARVSDYSFYLRTFAGAFFPWSLIAVGYGVDAVANRRRADRRVFGDEGLLFVWVLVILVFFSIARFKLDWYIFPAAPACCVLAARGWLALGRAEQRGTRGAVMIAAAILFVTGAVVGLALFRINLGINRGAIVLPATLGGAGMVMLLKVLRHRFAPPPSVAIPAGALLVAYTAVVVLGFPVLERSRPTAPIGRWVKRHTAPDSSIGVYRLEDWRASIRYYTDRRVTPLGGPDEVGAFLDNAPHAYVLMLRSDYDRVRATGADLVEVSGRPAIVGRSGKYLRRQIWGTLSIVTHRDNQDVAALNDPIEEER